MSFIDEVTGAVVGSLDGSYGAEDLWKDSPSGSGLTDPWKSEWGFTNRPIPAEDFGRQIKLPRPTKTTFHEGDDLADGIARSKGVDLAGGNFVGIAQSQIGAPYVWAVQNPYGPEGGPGAGFDCSGFTSWVYKRAFGVDLPHLSSAQQSQLAPVSRENLKPGDLVFYHYTDRNGPGVTADHVVVYIGDGQTIGASSSAGAITTQGVDWAHFAGGGAAPGTAARGASVNTPSELAAAGLTTGSYGAAGLGAPQQAAQAVTGKGIQSKRRGKAQPDPSVAELTVPFSETFGNTVGSLFVRPPTTARTADAQAGGNITGNVTMHSSAQDLQAVAHQLVQREGWSEADYRSLVELWNRESGWNPAAKNSIGALGIPQAYGHTLPDGYATNPLVQMQWGIDYIKQRYGSPSAALAHSNTDHWY